TLNEVKGCMYLGMNLSVETGKKILGSVSFTSVPISDRLKNLSSLSAASLDDPRLPLPEISRISAPPRMLRIRRDPPNPIPNFWILLCERSNSKPREYLGKGVRKILAIRSVLVLSPGSSIYWMLGYLKIL